MGEKLQLDIFKNSLHLKIKRKMLQKKPGKLNWKKVPLEELEDG